MSSLTSSTSEGQADSVLANAHGGKEEPTRAQYLALVCAEALSRGLVDQYECGMLVDNLMAAIPNVDNLEPERTQNLDDMTKEEWLDLDNFPTTFPRIGCNDSHEEAEQVLKELEETGQRKFQENDRVTSTDGMAPSIIEEMQKSLLSLGGKVEDLELVKEKHPESFIVYLCAKVWRLEIENGTEGCIGHAAKKDSERLDVKLFSDIPQDTMSIVDLHIPPQMSFRSFQDFVKLSPFVRHFVRKENPGLAQNLFIEDELVWRNTEKKLEGKVDSNAMARDYDAPGHGWYSHVTELKSPSGMLGKRYDWRALDTSDDWDSLLKILRANRGMLTAYLRHESSNDRRKFVDRKRLDEAREVEREGGHTFNFLLERHWDELQTKDLLRQNVPGLSRDD